MPQAAKRRRKRSGKRFLNCRTVLIVPFPRPVPQADVEMVMPQADVEMVVL